MICWIKLFDLQPRREEQRAEWKTVKTEERNIGTKDGLFGMRLEVNECLYPADVL